MRRNVTVALAILFVLGRAASAQEERPIRSISVSGTVETAPTWLVERAGPVQRPPIAQTKLLRLGHEAASQKMWSAYSSLLPLLGERQHLFHKAWAQPCNSLPSSVRAQ